METQAISFENVKDFFQSIPTRAKEGALWIGKKVEWLVSSVISRCKEGISYVANKINSLWTATAPIRMKLIQFVTKPAVWKTTVGVVGATAVIGGAYTLWKNNTCNIQEHCKNAVEKAQELVNKILPQSTDSANVSDGVDDKSPTINIESVN